MRWLLTALSIAVVIGLGTIFYLLAQPSGPRGGEPVAIAEQLVRNSLPGGVTIHFSDPVETSTEKLSDEKYRVTGWVDLVPKDGEATRQVYTCTMEKNANRQWVAEDISLMDQ